MVPPDHIASTNPGLTDDDVRQRVAQGLVNDLPDRSGKTVWDIVRTNVFTRINAMLGVLLAIVISTGAWINTAFGLLIVANSAIGIVQELRAKKTLDNLAVVGEAKPMVRRASGTAAISREEVVVDDIIEVAPGDQIVVDGEVIEADYFEVDESLLTGESDPISKHVGDPVMSGSFAVSGAGAYRATKVGADAYAAQLTKEASKFTLAESQLQSGINQILKVITWILIPVGIATVINQLSLPGATWRDGLLGMAGALVPMVPEGLVLLTSMAFALGVIRLGKKNVLVQELPAIEGLARVDVVCADKTGTLTENAMTVRSLEPLDGFTVEQARIALAQLVAADRHPNASMQAISAAVGDVSDPWPVVARAPFTSATKWSGVSFGDAGDWVLGAPEVLATGQVADQAQTLADQGLRVLLLGRSDVEVRSETAPGIVTPVALVVLDQKVRPEARQTLEYFNSQDVDVKIISGDNAASVGAVTRSLGVDSGEPVDARSLDTADKVSGAVEASHVFGRVKPEQKRAMVRALQEQGHLVAMTGDGVNDVLALKDSDLGVAMGSGSSAARSVAKVVLLDDNFATLPSVLGEGRRVIGNIERVAKLFLTKTVYSALLALMVVIWRVAYPFQPIHVTITGWFTIGIPAFLLSLAPNNDRARPGFVKRVMSFGLPAGIVVAVATFVTYRLLAAGISDEALLRQASTATLATLIVAATWVLAIVARPYRWWRLALVVVAYLSYAAIFFWDFSAQLFLLDPSNAAFMRVGLIVGLIGAAAIEAIWWVRTLLAGEKPRFWASAR